MRIKFNVRYLCAFILLFLIEVIIAVYTNDRFIRPYIGDVLVVVLIYSFIRTFVQIDTKVLPFYIFIFAVLVEFVQYLDLAQLLGLSEHSVIRIVIGTTFDIKDIACYFVGCLFLFLFELKKKADK